MIALTIRRTISMGHRLPNYDGICASLHGHNVTFEVCVRVNEFTDFKEIDRALEVFLSELDHAMVLWERDTAGRAACGQIPSQRVVLLSVEPTTEALAQLLFSEMSLHYDVAVVTVYETEKYSASCDKSSTKTIDVVRRV